MQKKRLRAMLLVLTGALIFGLSGCTGQATMEPIDEDSIRFIQFEPPKEGDRIAVVQTTMGDIKIRLFPDEAPKAVENFTTLVAQGYYDNFKIIYVKEKRAFISAQADGGGKSIYGEPFENQYSNNLWHFPGAVSSISDKEGYGDSRFYVVGDSQMTDELIEQMQKAMFPGKVVEQYRKSGGTPELDRGCSIFAQVYEGMDVVNRINQVETAEGGVPNEDIFIRRITLDTYQMPVQSAEQSA